MAVQESVSVDIDSRSIMGVVVPLVDAESKKEAWLREVMVCLIPQQK